MKKTLILVLSLSTLYSFAQKVAKPDAFAKTITPADLKKQLYIVAGPEMEGRETGTAGQRKAAAYIESQFKQIGLQPGNNGSYQLSYDFYQDSLIDASLQVNGQSFQLDKDFNASTSNIQATMRFSEVIVIGPNSLDSLKNANLAGRLILAPSNVTIGMRGPNSGIFTLLMSKGVAGILSVSGTYPKSTPANRLGFGSLNGFKRNITPQIFTISENVAHAIVGSDYDQLKSNTSAVRNIQANVLLDVKKATIAHPSSDVVGILPGTDLKDQYLVISAHYDHLGIRNGQIHYGADDDGSGTVSIMQIAQAFAKAKAAGKGPRRTIVFLANSGEEEGLWGSEYFSNHPTIPLDKTTADLNIDMIGRTDATRGDTTNYVYVVGDDKLSSDLKPISEAQNNKYTKLQLDYKFNDPKDPNRIYYRSDHFNFARKGVPIIFYYDGMLGADYHKPTDTPDKINYELMAKRAQLVFYTAWEMANRNDMLKRDIPLDNNVFGRM